MSRVFILEPCQQFPVDGAAEFGEVVYMYDKHFQHPPPLSPTLGPALLDKLVEYRFNPKVDYIVATGKMIQLFTLAAVVASKYGKFRALCFDARERARRYVEVPMGV